VSSLGLLFLVGVADLLHIQDTVLPHLGLVLMLHLSPVLLTGPVGSNIESVPYREHFSAALGSRSQMIETVQPVVVGRFVRVAAQFRWFNSVRALALLLPVPLAMQIARLYTQSHASLALVSPQHAFTALALEAPQPPQMATPQSHLETFPHQVLFSLPSA
jgi:hypothetical protein